MMRSFGARPDCSVIDEPFFAPFLKASGKAHPGRAETLAAHETDPQKVAELCLAETGYPYVFQKHMPHHMLPGFPMAWAQGAKHFFLLRHPRRVIASYAKSRAKFDLHDLGFAAQRQLWDQLGRPPVIHSECILRDPEGALTELCGAIDIPFDSAMLSWPAGPRDEDGAWAPWWYDNVWASTGFGVPPGPLPDIISEYLPLLSTCRSDYEALAAESL
jgi:hypothetical protein